MVRIEGHAIDSMKFETAARPEKTFEIPGMLAAAMPALGGGAAWSLTARGGKIYGKCVWADGQAGRTWQAGRLPWSKTILADEGEGVTTTTCQ